MSEEPRRLAWPLPIPAFRKVVPSTMSTHHSAQGWLGSQARLMQQSRRDPLRRVQIANAPVQFPLGHGVSVHLQLSIHTQDVQVAHTLLKGALERPEFFDGQQCRVEGGSIHK